MALRRKVFVGSLFEFSKNGEEFLQQLRKRSETQDQVPLIFFNENLSLFSGEFNVGDNVSVSYVISSLDHYLKQQGKKPSNLVDQPKVTPIPGTTISDEIEQSEPLLPERNQLVQIEDSSDEEVQDPGDTYWKPRCGETSILSADIAQEIANLSGCRVFFEKALQRVKLVTGNIPLGLEKLRVIEGVLTLSTGYKTRSGPYSIRAVKAIRYNPKAAIRSVRMASDSLFGHPKRVIVDFTSQQGVLRARLAEIRIEHQGSYERPDNLDQAELSVTAEYSESRKLRQVMRPSFGGASCAEPQSATKEPSDTAEFANNQQPSTKFLPEKDVKRVSEWREQVDQQATADALPADPLPEPKPSVGRRRVAVESSSDEEDEEEPPSKPPPKQTWDTSDSWEPEVAPLYNASRHIDWAETLEVKATRQNSDDVDQDADNTHAELVQDEVLPVDPPPENALPEVSITRPPTKNVFDVLTDDNDAHDADTEESTNEKSSSSVKQLNVTFEEPEQSPPASIVKGKSPVARRPELFEHPNSYSAHNVDKRQSEIGKYSTHHKQSYPRLHGSENGSRGFDNVPRGPRSFAIATSSPARPRNYQHLNKSVKFDGGYAERQSRRNAGLIDVSSNSPPESPVLPPPGFDFRHPSNNVISEDLVSYSADPVSRPALLPDPSNEIANTTSSSRSESSSLGPNPQDFSPQLTVPKRNINYLREEAKAKLEAMSKTKGRKSAKDSDRGPASREKVQKADEYSSRRYHRTMSQKAPMPSKKGKKSQPSQNESKAEKEARIARAMLEAYGSTNGAKAATSRPPAQRAAQPELMSTKKRQILKKNDMMAEMHKDVLAKNADQDAAREMVAALSPFLKATRAFKGSVTLEMQFGQAIMIDQNDRIDDQRLYNPEDWLRLLNSESSDIETLFTNKISTNGRDVDRLLSMKTGQPPMKLWDENHISGTIDFEFHCCDKTGFEFSIVLDQDDKHTLLKPTTTIGKIPLYCPAQVWDACAVISGWQAPLCPSTEIIEGVEDFIAHLYIPAVETDGQISIFHRLPKNGAFAVQAISVKTTTVHECTVSNQSNIQLHLTQIKDLLHRNHATDKTLFNSYEETFETMTSTRRLHYEVSLVHKEIEASFKDNPDIELGTLTPNELSVSFAQMHDLVKISLDMLEGMDWMGAKNYGTLQRMHDMKAQQHANVAASLPPNVATTVRIPMGTTAPPTAVPSVYQTQKSRLGVGTVTTGNAGPEPITRIIRGVRANTSAELYQEGGHLFYYGQGGARIPVVQEQLEGLGFDVRGPVAPDDSASQIGNGINARQRAALAQRKLTEQMEKPAGFW